LQQREEGGQGLAAEEAGSQPFITGMDGDIEGRELIREDTL
jgi:hypothetical protein